MVYICFNIFIITLSVTFFMTQYNNPQTLNSTITLPELKPLTSIYDSALNEADPMLSRLIPGLAYILIVFVSIMTVAIGIYTASRFFSRHPNYIMSLFGMALSICALLAPRYLVARVLDSYIVGAFVICALIFDIISITWIYGAKNIYTDLEFSIGRPILKTWVFMWCIIPVLLAGLLIWWASAFIFIDLVVVSIPRWTPIVISLAIIVVMACVEVYQQVDYNCCSMIQEAAQSSTDWGPADPIVRHAWKQWRSVCEDTGQKDFTLRRRGTRDYTHSIKKGQYSRGKYATADVRKASTGGSSSPNYSGGSIFEDSAIEEDVSVEKYQGYQQQNGGNIPNKPYRYSIDSRKLSVDGGTDLRHEKPDNRQKQYFYVQSATTTNANLEPSDYVSKVEILSASANTLVPTSTTTTKKTFVKNPMARVIDLNGGGGMLAATVPPYSAGETNVGSMKRDREYTKDNTRLPNGGGTGTNNNLNGDHICWRKFSVNSEEFSTEL